ncbi:uncharacterized protein V2V93DRAFT_371265 [Kockiozyma suomiensis]|uniref:uncharacterized protein n=1 Tax=Kockiozyma suomiensis TaxID=1337062 RepID=UPI003344199E
MAQQVASLPFDPVAECRKLLDLRARVLAGAFPQFSIKSSNDSSTSTSAPPPPPPSSSSESYRHADDYHDQYRPASYATSSSPAYLPADEHKRKAAPDWPDDTRARPPPPPQAAPYFYPAASDRDRERQYYDDYNRPYYHHPPPPAPPAPPPPPSAVAYDYRAPSQAGSIQMSSAVLPANVVIGDGYTRDAQRGYELFIPSAAKRGRYLPPPPLSPGLPAAPLPPPPSSLPAQYGQYAPPPPQTPSLLPPSAAGVYSGSRREGGQRWGGYPPPT